MSEQLKPNFTQMPNFLFDELLASIGLAEWKVVSMICRRTYGWRKGEDRISLTQFEKGTGLSRKTVVKALDALSDDRCGLVVRSRTPKGDSWRLNVDCDITAAISALRCTTSTSVLSTPVTSGEVTPLLVEMIPSAGVPSTHTKETNTKEIIKRKNPAPNASLIGEESPLSEVVGRKSKAKDSHSDPRHSPIRQLIQEENRRKFSLDATWDGREGKALSDFLKANPTWPLERICGMVKNRYESLAVTSQRPAQWIPRLGEYSNGPLGEYNRPTKRSRTGDYLRDQLPDQVFKKAATEEPEWARSTNG